MAVGLAFYSFIRTVNYSCGTAPDFIHIVDVTGFAIMPFLPRVKAP